MNIPEPCLDFVDNLCKEGVKHFEIEITLSQRDFAEMIGNKETYNHGFLKDGKFIIYGPNRSTVTIKPT